MHSYLGIDPGKQGGFAIIRDGKCTETLVMPINGKELVLGKIAEWVDNGNGASGFSEKHPIDIAVLEKASAWPGQGVTSMFSFGECYGAIKGILAALNISTRIVTPQAWKKVVLAGTARDKDAAINHVRRAYPGVKVVPEGKRKAHSGLCDAVCIAEYGWRTFK